MSDRDDLDLEARLRRALRERADAIDTSPPGLDVGAPAAPASIVGAAPGERRGVALLALAAAVILLAGIAIVVVRGDVDEPDQRVRAEEPASDPLPGEEQLPAGVDATELRALYRSEREQDPTVVARAYVAAQLAGVDGDPAEVAASLEVTEADRRDDLASVAWADPSTGGSGTVLVRVGRTGTEVVAALAPGIDLADVRAAEGGATGAVGVADDLDDAEVLVDVWPFGHAITTTSATDPATSAGVGLTAIGEAPFTTTAIGGDPLLTVRVGRPARTFSAVALPAAGSDPAPAPDPDPRCAAAEADLGAPAGAATAHRTDAAATDPFAASDARTAADVVRTWGDQLGIELEPRAVLPGTPTSWVAAETDGGRVVEAMVTAEGDGRLTVVSATTTDACSRGGPTGVADPSEATIAVAVPSTAGAATGELWYELADGTVRTAALERDDLARRAARVEGGAQDLRAVAVVLRDAGGRVVAVGSDRFVAG